MTDLVAGCKEIFFVDGAREFFGVLSQLYKPYRNRHFKVYYITGLIGRAQYRRIAKITLCCYFYNLLL